jgi:hypothetical protein
LGAGTVRKSRSPISRKHGRRLGPASDHPERGERSHEGRAIEGRSDLVQQGAGTDAGHQDEHVEGARAQGLREAQGLSVLGEHHLPQGRRAQRLAPVPLDERRHFRGPPALEGHHRPPREALLR